MTILRLKTTQVAKAREILARRQDGKCPVCGRVFSKSVVGCLDHDHKTGLIRGVLCRACNRLEGQVQNRILMAGGKEDPIKLLRGLCEYRAYHAENPSKFTHPTHKTETEKHTEKLKKQRERRAKLKAEQGK